MKKRHQRNDESSEHLLSSGLVFGILGIASFVVTLTYLVFTLCNKSGLPADHIASSHALEKSDWLGFWGCVLGVLSTTIFSIILETKQYAK